MRNSRASWTTGGRSTSPPSAEAKRALRADIPVKERGDWEAYLDRHGAEVRALDAEIEEAEREIDTIVYRLFDLTPDEIALLESSITGQY